MKGCCLICAHSLLASDEWIPSLRLQKQKESRACHLDSLFWAGTCGCQNLECKVKSAMQAYGQPSSSTQPPEEEPPDVECHICMDAEVEVESLPCKHR